MDTNIDYQSYIKDTKNLRTYQARTDRQAPYKDAFETIYNDAIEEDVGLTSAKSYIENLTDDELKTLQQFAGLADPINKETISDEGAYNLLVHHNEQYDFDKDGLVNVGAAKKLPIVPTTMPADVRPAYIEAVNSLQPGDRLIYLSLTIDTSRISSAINNTPYSPQTIDYDFLTKRVDELLNPKGGVSTSEETKVIVKQFWEVFDSLYTGEKNTNDSTKVDSEVEKFLNDLRTKGAATYLADLNKEKIEEKVKEFEQKLIKEMGDSKESMATIDNMVNQYRKQLIEELQASLENDDKKSPVPNKQAMIKVLLDMKQDQSGPLKKLLEA